MISRGSMHAFATITLLATVAGSARAAVNINFDGYATSEINGQSTGGISWSGTANTFTVTAGEGVGGSNALVSNGTQTTGASTLYTPNKSSFNNVAFSTASTVLSYSLDLKLISVDSSSSASALIDRIWLGITSSSSVSSIYLAIYGDKTLWLDSPGSSKIKKLADLSDLHYHTISGTIDYTTAAGTITILADGAQVHTGDFVAPMNTGTNSTYYTNYGSIKINRNSGHSGDVFAVDNIQMDLVPEPSAVGLLGLGAASMIMMGRRQRPISARND